MVWGFTIRYPGHIAIAALALLVAAGATSGVPYAFKLIIDKGFAAGAGTHARHRALVRISAAARRHDGAGDRDALLFRLMARRADRCRHPACRAPQPATPVARLLRREPPGRDHVPHHGRHDDHRAGRRHDRVRRARNCVLGIVCVGILFALAPKLALSGAAWRSWSSWPIVVLGRRVRAISTRSQDRIADVGTVTSEVLGAMKIVQAFNQQGRETSRFAEAVERVFSTAKRRILLRAIMTAIVDLPDVRRDHAGSSGEGRSRSSSGRMSGGTIAAFVLYGGLLAGAFGELSEVYGDLLRAAGASERLGRAARCRARHSRACRIR